LPGSSTLPSFGWMWPVTVFTLRDGKIVRLRDHVHRANALAEAGLGDYRWR